MDVANKLGHHKNQNEDRVEPSQNTGFCPAHKPERSPASHDQSVIGMNMS
jgi:hypothetical protein